MNILLIEPDPVLVVILQESLYEHHLIFARDGHHAIQCLEENPTDVIISEHSFKTHNSFEFLYELRSYPEWQKLPFILFTATYLSDTVRNSDAYKQLGINTYLYKPSTTIHDLYLLICRLDKQHAAR